MTINTATPYLFFNGKADEAAAFYANALGGTVETLMRYGDMDKSCPEADKARVMHAVVQFGQTRIMLSDTHSAHGPTGVAPTPHEPAAQAPNLADFRVRVAIDFDDRAQMADALDALAAGGNVQVPIRDVPWGAFGMLTDRYQICWMFNHSQPPA